jgi:hypothetical protein
MGIIARRRSPLLLSRSEIFLRGSDTTLADFHEVNRVGVVAQTDGTKRMVSGATQRYGEASNRRSELTGYGGFLACVGIEMPYEPLAVDRSELAVSVSALRCSRPAWL